MGAKYVTNAKANLEARCQRTLRYITRAPNNPHIARGSSITEPELYPYHVREFFYLIFSGSNVLLNMYMYLFR